VTAAFAELESARTAVLEYARENAKVIETYEAMRSEANSKLNSCKALFTQHDALGESYAGFSRGAVRSVDAKKLVELAPATLELVDFSISIDLFEKCLADGLIDDTVLSEVLSTKPRISSPKSL
jgi:hypothetical protein